MRSVTHLSKIACVLAASALLASGCRQPKYGQETKLTLTLGTQVWAIAPAINLSGQEQIDSILQADLAYQQLQEVKNLTVIPVNRVAEVYASLGIDRIQSEEQANVVCELLGCDALVIPTITFYDPYNPPKFGASLQVFGRPGSFSHQQNVNPRDLVRQASPASTEALPKHGNFLQAVGVYDAQNGSVRDAVLAYAKGRNDPNGPLKSKEYFVSMDRYCSFVYFSLIGDLLQSPGLQATPPQPIAPPAQAAAPTEANQNRS